MKILRLSLMVLCLLALASCSQGPAPISPEEANDDTQLETLARAGRHIVFAHRGDQAVRPSSWLKSEWDNSRGAILSALNSGVPRIEIDLKLNRSAQALAQTPYGILYVHHDSQCTEVDSLGRSTGVKRNVENDAPYLVDRCAERLETILNLRDNRGYTGRGRWVLEMKTGDNDNYMALALGTMLQARGQLGSEIISSLSRDLLTGMKNFGNNAGVSMNLMDVYPFAYWVPRWQLRKSKRLGFNYVAANVIFRSNIAYAKDIGLNIGGWSWAPISSAQSGNQWAVDRDLDFMLSDNIYHLSGFTGWNW